MPNIYYNTLVIKGDSNILSNFYNNNKTDNKGLSFKKYIPLPNKINNKKLEIGLIKENNWYDWSLKNWGSKWDAFNVIVKYNIKSNILKYKFMTAINPPVIWLKSIANKYNMLNFELSYKDEENMIIKNYNIINGLKLSI